MANTPNSIVLLDQFGNLPPSIKVNGAIIGVTDGSNAAAGIVGEFVQAILAFGGSGSLVTATPKSLISISLTAGDWDVWGSGGINPAAGQTDINVFSSISLVTNTSGAIETTRAQISAPATSIGVAVLPTPIVRMSITATTTVFLVMLTTWTGGAATMAVFGSISARRAR